MNRPRMKGIEQVFNYRFPTTDWSIARSRKRVSELADRFRLKLEFWDDQLGPVSGVVLKMPSGRIVALCEYQLLVEQGSDGALDISLDASEVAAVGVEPLLNEMLECLALERDALTWINSDAAQEYAANFVRRVQDMQKGR